jgi:cytochrome b pre-mRNA-processing protein 3
VSIFSRLFGKRGDDRAQVRPLWRRVVEVAREREWYVHCGVADSVPGRFDAITLVLAAVLLRMERDEALIEPSVRLTELFVEDMDGQLRNSGVGDLSVGKHMGKLMGVLGGRLGALREALEQDAAGHGEAALTQFAARNATLIEDGDPAKVAERLAGLVRGLDMLTSEDLLAGKIAR